MPKRKPQLVNAIAYIPSSVRSFLYPQSSLVWARSSERGRKMWKRRPTTTLNPCSSERETSMVRACTLEKWKNSNFKSSIGKRGDFLRPWMQKSCLSTAAGVKHVTTILDSRSGIEMGKGLAVGEVRQWLVKLPSQLLCSLIHEWLERVWTPPDLLSINVAPCRNIVDSGCTEARNVCFTWAKPPPLRSKFYVITYVRKANRSRVVITCFALQTTPLSAKAWRQLCEKKLQTWIKNKRV